MEKSEIQTITYTFTFLLLGFGFFILFVFLLNKRRQNRHLRQIADLKKEMVKSQLEIQEQTLRSISQEIHDNIGQILTLVKLQLFGMRNQKPDQVVYEPVIDLVSKSISDLRNLSKSLHPDRIAAVGLADSIAHEMQLLQNTNAIQTAFTCEGKVQRLPPEKEIIVFRIFQELMNNMMKHSGASLFSVDLNYQETFLIVSIIDNGKGFTADVAQGIGFTSMRTRAKLINADLAVESEKDCGTKVKLTTSL